MSTTNFSAGDKIKENRLGATPTWIIEVRGNVLVTGEGFLHASKAVKL